MLDPVGAAIGAGIVRAFEAAVRMQHHRAGVAHDVGIGFIQDVDVVAGGSKRFDQVVGKPRFEPQRGARCAPRAAQNPARPVDRVRERLPEIHVAREQSGLRLRLAVAARATIGGKKIGRAEARPNLLRRLVVI